MRIGYYLYCLACLGLIRCFPAWTSVIAAVESCLSLCGLIIETGARIVTMPDIVLDGGDPINYQQIMNFMLSGNAAYVALVLRSRQARADLLSWRTGF